MILDSKLGVRDIFNFVRKSLSSSLISLNEENYAQIHNNEDIWLIDYFAPVDFGFVHSGLNGYFLVVSALSSINSGTSKTAFNDQRTSASCWLH